jgi:ADP-ribose pyrophosphatase
MTEEKKNPWTINSSKKIYENNWIRLDEFDVMNPVGKPGIYGVVHFQHLAIGALPLDENYNTWLVGQFRFAVNAYSWEMPEGGGKMSDHPLETAKRELLEETGIEAKEWSELMRSNLSNSCTDELAIMYVAKGLTFHEPEPEETEKLHAMKLPLQRAYEMVMNGEILDSMTQLSILKAKILIDEGKL